ncbi:hypothetical protein MKW92_001616 [Papaver armeniacum]|nr:hypothetical protein MKW92_001616 [Papaver armeniacum]
MATAKPFTNNIFHFFLFIFILTAVTIQGLAVTARRVETLSHYQQQTPVVPHSFASLQELNLKGVRDGWNKKRNSRRLMIGSTAPTCTYNECRGCKFRCRAEQIPVDANDPVNSAYHYRCVCHR